MVLVVSSMLADASMESFIAAFFLSSCQTSITDSDYNLEPSCLSRCSTELFSEASWEQVDKQDTEVHLRNTPVEHTCGTHN